MFQQILEYTRQDYIPEEFPALQTQIKCNLRTKPLAGLHILDATPIFRNTTIKYASLIAAGAKLSISDFGGQLPSDPAIIKQMAAFGIEYLTTSALQNANFDLVLDCGGLHKNVKSRLGYCELTRSGVYHYQNCNQPVFLADSGRVKVIETALGTGDGFCRAMRQLNFGSLAGRKFTVFGFGKVGLGITLRLLECGCRVTVMEAPDKLSAIQCCPAVSYLNKAEVNKTLADSFCAVTATGRAGAAGNCADFEKFFDSPLLLANMGVEDEFGPGVPGERVLNHKKPLNFILQEPTQLKYIDPTLALHNLGAELLQNGKLTPGIHEPESGQEEDIIRTITKYGSIGAEINKINRIYGKNVLEE